MGATAADGTGLRRLAGPALMRLSAETGDTVFLMARAGFNTVCVDRQQGAYVIDSLTGHIGGQIPMGLVRPARRSSHSCRQPRLKSSSRPTNRCTSATRGFRPTACAGRCPSSASAAMVWMKARSSPASPRWRCPSCRGGGTP